jgi:hypothetical protein
VVVFVVILKSMRKWQSMFSLPNNILPILPVLLGVKPTSLIVIVKHKDSMSKEKSPRSQKPKKGALAPFLLLYAF